MDRDLLAMKANAHMLIKVCGKEKEYTYIGTFLVPKQQQKQEACHCTVEYSNINGISYSDHNNQALQFKSNVIKNIKCDILCISETFLKKNQGLEIDGYSWI